MKDLNFEKKLLIIISNTMFDRKLTVKRFLQSIIQFVHVFFRTNSFNLIHIK